MTKLKYRGLSLLMAGVMSMSIIVSNPLLEEWTGTTAVAEQTTSGIEVVENSLQVNGAINPLGVDDATPAFSWQLSSATRGNVQTAYKIVVKSGEETVWDSGKVESSANYEVIYNGNALQSTSHYDWELTIWDKNGKSDTAASWFETGFMSEADWSADWIGEPEYAGEDMSFNGAAWIWDREGHTAAGIPQETQYFRFTFTPSKTVEKVRVAFTADDSAVLYFNGEQKMLSTQGEDAWKKAVIATIDGSDVVSGKNAVSFSATNAVANGYAGLLAKVEVTYTDGTKDTYSTGSDWKISPEEPASGWTEVSFDDSAWKTPSGGDIVSYGSSPWGDSNVSFGGATKDDLSALMLRRDFTAKGAVKSARAYISGMGLYEFKINGEYADDSVLNPAHTDYNDTVLYDVYDVTDLLSEGENAIGVYLGNGFFNEARAGWNWQNADWRARPRMIFELHITYENGETEKILSDSSWKYSSDGEITENGIYHGETIDARKEQNFTVTSYDDSLWQGAQVVSAPDGTLTWQDMEPMRRTAAFGVDSNNDGLDEGHGVTIESDEIEITNLGGGKWMVKNPRMITGWSRIVFRNTTAGDEIVISYGETLADNGSLNVKDEGGVFQQDNYICKDAGADGEVYEPTFNYKGFQYVQIEGYDGTLTKADVVNYMINSDVEETSEFLSSNEMFTELHDLMTATLLNNFQGKPTDTPYLEKNGWLGDVNVSLDTMSYDFDIARFMSKFIGDISDGQDSSGNIPQLVPIYEWGTANYPVWNTVYIFAVEELYSTYGLESLIPEYYDGMKSLIELDITTMGNRYLWPTDVNNLGDWVSPIGDENGSYHEHPYEDSSLYSTAYVYQALGTMQTFAEKLGKTEDVKRYAEIRGNILTAFNNKFYNNGVYTPEQYYGEHKLNRTEYRQSANILALAFDMVADENVEKVAENLVKDIIAKDYHLDTGIIGTKYILSVLCDNGYADVAYRLINQTTYPSWGYWLTQDATTTWEMYESTSRSRNHYFLGTYDEWFFSYLGGVQNVENGYESFDLEPVLAGDLTEASISLDTVRGELSSAWKYLSNNRVQFTITIPFGSTATLYLPTKSTDIVKLDGVALTDSAEGVSSVSVNADKAKVQIVLGGGTYVFECTPDARENYTGTLDTLIAEAQAFAEEDYETAAWAAFQTELQKAVSARENSLSQSAVNEAANALSAAIQTLKTKEYPVRAELKAMIADIRGNSELLDAYYYEGNARTVFMNSLMSAEAAAKDKSLAETDMQTQVDALDAAIDRLLSYRTGNLALGRSVRTSSAVSDTNWKQEYLNDGNATNVSADGEYCGWTSNNSTKAQHEEWFIVDLGYAYKFDTLHVYPSAKTEDAVAYGMPKAFVIEISNDGITWETLIEKENYTAVQYKMHEFNFESVRARYIRMTGTKLNSIPTDGGQYRMQIAEFEVYNTLPADTTELETLMERYNGLNRNNYTTDSLLALEEVVGDVLKLQKRENLTIDDQAEVDALAERFENALDSLVLKEGVSTGDNSSGNEDSTDGTSDSSNGQEPGGSSCGGCNSGIGSALVGVAILPVIAGILLKKKEN